MSVIVTDADVKALCKTAMADAVIDLTINSVQTKIGQCVCDTYDDDTAKLIIMYAVCHFISASGSGDVTSRKAANGSSVSFEQHGTGEGLKSTQFGRLLIMADTEGCHSKLVADTFTFLSIGDPARPC